MRHLITAGLPYINGIKHLGNMIGSMLPADVYARFLRQRGEEVLYVCGTDEHGAPAEIAAAEAGEPVEAYCARMHEVQADIYRRFGISCDHFGRTSSPSNHLLTQQIFSELDAHGFIERRPLAQFYSLDDETYLPDRYIIGTCPRCGYDKARGDQCESCTTLLDPTDLSDPRSAISGSRRLELRTTTHLFLRLSALEPTVRAWVERQAEWPALTRQIAEKWLNEGLQDRCITRNLRWGIPVPIAELAPLVFYVWFDAPIGYISITRDWAAASGDPEGWRRWWRDADDVHYTQFMGKDNLPFHTVMFPAMLLGADPSWKLPQQIKGFHWLDYYAGKFSTSLKRGVFTDVALELFPADYWRYGLLALVPETSDSTFTWTQFAQAINKDLADVLGNFVHRIASFCANKLGPTVPAGGDPGPIESTLIADCREALAEFEGALAGLHVRTAMRAIRRLWTLGNSYVDARAPWTLLKTDRDAAALVVRTCFNLIGLFAAAAMPLIPSIASSFLEMLHVDAATARPDQFVALDRIRAGQPFERKPPAIRRIEPAEIEALEARFGS